MKKLLEMMTTTERRYFPGAGDYQGRTPRLGNTEIAGYRFFVILSGSAEANPADATPGISLVFDGKYHGIPHSAQYDLAGPLTWDMLLRIANTLVTDPPASFGDLERLGFVYSR